MEIKDLLRENIRRMAPYSTARDEYQGDIGIYLDANENPYENGFNRYPDPHQKELRQRIARLKGVDPAQVFIGNGSDEPIDLVYRMFCEPRIHNAVSITPTYGMYKVAAATNDVEFREVLLGADFSVNAENVLAATDENTRLVWLCSPNNPSANLLDRNEIEKILVRFPGIVVIDEAYIDFAGEAGFLPVLKTYPNLVVLQTLSKAWGLAGLRLGLAFAQPAVVDVMGKVKYPYNINCITQKLVMEHLARPETVAAQVAELVAERKKALEELAKLSVIRKVFPADANFMLIRVDAPRKVYNALIAEGVIVRDRSRIAGCEGCLRITVGTPAENQKMLALLKTM
ncbi:MAG: histidinol-phosphate transaminase [Rikenellaceae bacterium]|jgi:histidinol-phosphate aminotransferase|nr:histidinol-phosphate transaminase [Rikenellaceae bacterium]